MFSGQLGINTEQGSLLETVGTHEERNGEVKSGSLLLKLIKKSMMLFINGTQLRSIMVPLKLFLMCITETSHYHE